ncbi:hypothetical protein C6W20_10090 [Bacillus sp. NMCN6]|nr:hypothetical protein C6W21_10460 [Bacillus sp. NMCN1]PRR97930.1 hypothetical protein C6W20_10090 [Bacillus sp. NMCN6]
MNKKYKFNVTGFIIMIIFVVVMFNLTIKTENFYLIPIMVLGAVIIQFLFNHFIRYDFFKKISKR